MGKNYLVLFQIGPVQEFISTARKTQDLWSGSFLLSFFSAVGINCATKKLKNKSLVLFPSISENPLFQQVESQPLPWKKAPSDALHPSLPNPDALHPSLPNRFLILIPDDHNPEEILKDCKNEIERVWKNEIAKKVKEVIERGIKIDQVWSAIWNRQIPRAFEILYVWRLCSENEDYPIAYRETEKLLGLRKATRWFEEDEAEPGHKCSLCGIRQSLQIEGIKDGRKGLREFWNENFVKKSSLGHRFREGEHLCAVCLVKRLAPQVVFGKDNDVPSTSSIAVSAFMERAVEKLSQTEQNLLDGFAQSVKGLAPQVNAPPVVDTLPRLKDKWSSKTDFLQIDGDWLLTETYDRIKNKKEYCQNSKVLELLNEARGSFKKLKQALRDLEKDEYRPPCKYFCLLAADGDNMGEALARVKNPENHTKFSDLTGKFAIAHALNVLQQEHLGYVIYFGGDEGLSFLALDHLFPALKALRGAWENQVRKPLKEDGFENPPTLSVGVCIAHHQHSLRFALQEAREALKLAKSKPNKDCFASFIIPRSGSPVKAVARWEGASLDTLSVLEELVKAFKGMPKLSTKWVNDLEREQVALQDLAGRPFLTELTEIIKNEIARLIKRHWPQKANPDSLISQVTSLYDNISYGYGIPNARRFQEFLGLMNLAVYVAKGGGK